MTLDEVLALVIIASICGIIGCALGMEIGSCSQERKLRKKLKEWKEWKQRQEKEKKDDEVKEDE